jgi:hypothetical protein
MPSPRLIPLALAFALLPLGVTAQIIRNPAAHAAGDSESTAPRDIDVGRRAQADFEDFHRANIPSANTRPPANCDETVGRFCYWYDERAPAPPREPLTITQRREQFIALLDTLARHSPDDRWLTGQRVRYLAEAERFSAALEAAKECRVGGWWCDILEGFSLHLMGEYVAAESVYDAAIGKMQPHDRCEWRRIDLLVDDDTRQQYKRLPCDDPQRRAFEDRTWFFARTLYSMKGNDSRTEYFARMTMTELLHDAPSLYQFGFDDDERELLLRFGWPRAWTSVFNIAHPTYTAPKIGEGPPGGLGGPRGPGDPKGPSTPGGNTMPPGMGGLGRGGRGPVTGPGAGGRGGINGRGSGPVSEDGLGWQPAYTSFIGHEPMPAYRYVPPGFVLNNPSISDSSAWRLQLPPVIGRYAPPYATALKPLEHQKAMFRRGDSAFVVMAYDARTMKELDSARINAALVITPSDKPRNYAAIVRNAKSAGVLTVKAPWGPLLMSAEVAAPERKAVARARYGLAPPLAIGERVTISDLLFYKPYGSFPASVEEAAPHAVPTERLRADEKLGVYWEAYGTDPAGEKMSVSLTVVKESEELGFFRRQARALNLTREKTPVVITVQDQSARGSRTSPRALEVDIRTLKKGAYIVQLEIQVAGQFVVRADHRIEVIGP